MATRVIDDTKLQNIAVAIQAKDSGGQMTVDEMPSRVSALPTDLIPKTITENGTYTAADDNADGYSEVRVDVGIPVEEKDINFYDYDGSLLFSYTFNEALELTQLPEPPEHTGLIFQEWNWEVEEIKENAINKNYAVVGATYITDNGATRLILKIPNKQCLSFDLVLGIISGTVSVYIDGDFFVDVSESSNSYVNHTIPIKINDNGIFPIYHTIEILYNGTGKYRLGTSSISGAFVISLPSLLEQCFLGNNLELAPFNFYMGFYNLDILTIPNTEKISNIQPTQVVTSARRLRAFIFPKKIIEIPIYTGIRSKIISVSPKTKRMLHHAFSECQAKKINFERVSSIGSSCADSAYLETINFSNEISTLEAYAFLRCYSLTEIRIPKNILTINERAFNGTSLLTVDLSDYNDVNNLPLLSNSNAFPDSVRQYEVLNQEMLEAFEAATNWSTYAGKYVIKGATS